ncbi:MAG: Xaa-Pro peptidase family protein [Desulfobacterales bacterium]|jgi:Xaa-Pro aminopeptidase|nr:Xaa-Pro peptidase family protein [Desulfobacterales bacterium]
MIDDALNTPRTEIERRIAALQNVLTRRGLDAALILQKTDLFYFSGTIQQSTLYVPATGEPLLMVNRSFERARAESPLAHVVPLSGPSRIPLILKAAGCARPSVLGFELDVLPVNLFRKYEELFPGVATADVSTDIRLIRAVKSPYEIELIREAARRSDRVAGLMPELIRPGMTEIELAGRVEAEMRRLGHQGIVRMRLWGGELFYGHLLAGESGGVASYLASPTGGRGVGPAVAQGAGMRPIGRNEPIVLDYVFAFQGYISDHTRVFSLGPVQDELQRGHAAMLELQAEIARRAVPGAASGAIYDAALAWVQARGLAGRFMGATEERVRFVGHGVGLELDEFPFLNTGQALPLQAGMVVAVEPKLVFPGRGVVGIENTHVVTPGGLEQLGRYPEEITVI